MLRGTRGFPHREVTSHENQGNRNSTGLLTNSDTVAPRFWAVDWLIS